MFYFKREGLQLFAYVFSMFIVKVKLYTYASKNSSNALRLEYSKCIKIPTLNNLSRKSTQGVILLQLCIKVGQFRWKPFIKASGSHEKFDLLRYLGRYVENERAKRN